MGFDDAPADDPDAWSDAAVVGELHAVEVASAIASEGFSATHARVPVSRSLRHTTAPSLLLLSAPSPALLHFSRSR